VARLRIFLLKTRYTNPLFDFDFFVFTSTTDSSVSIPEASMLAVHRTTYFLVAILYGDL